MIWERPINCPARGREGEEYSLFSFEKILNNSTWDFLIIDKIVFWELFLNKVDKIILLDFFLHRNQYLSYLLEKLR